MGGTSEAVEIINRLSGVAGKLDSEHDERARKEAIQLCRNLITRLEKPENTAVDLAFSVSA